MQLLCRVQTGSFSTTIPATRCSTSEDLGPRPRWRYYNLSLSLSVPPLCPPLSPSPPLSLLLCDVKVCMTRWSVRCSTIVSTNVCVVYFRGTVGCSAQHYSFHEIIVRGVYFRVILRCLVQHYSFHEWLMLCNLWLPWGVRCSASFTIIDSCCVFQGYCSVFGAAL